MIFPEGYGRFMAPLWQDCSKVYLVRNCSLIFLIDDAKDGRS
jgi:hypothetical protein